MGAADYDYRERVVPECDGRCCFRLWFSRRDLERIRNPRSDLVDREVIEAMLVPTDETLSNGRQGFTCRHFDGRLCGIYETRPEVCRSYPYGTDPCAFCGGVGTPLDPGVGSPEGGDDGQDEPEDRRGGDRTAREDDRSGAGA